MLTSIARRRTEKEEEKFALCESIGHRPLRGRCPKKEKKERKKKRKKEEERERKRKKERERE